MSLSKKNLDKLNTLIKKKSTVNNNKLNDNNNPNKNPPKSDNSFKATHPNQIFYSIIDNSNNIYETLEANQLLKASEESFPNLDSSKTNYSRNLSIEEKLYDEFNYLLDE